MIKKRLLTTLFVIFLVLTVAVVSATIDSNRTKADHIVTLTIEVNGDGYTDPPTGLYEIGTDDSMVTITAYPNSGWQFDGWDGDMADPNSAMTTVFVDYSTTVTANFSETTPTLTLTPPPTPDDEEASLNMWVVIGAVLGVLMVGGVAYYVRR